MKIGSGRANDVIGEGFTNTEDNGRARQKLSDDCSFKHKMSADHQPLSVRELSRIKRYHTVDIDTDFIANFNHDFINDNVI